METSNLKKLLEFRTNRDTSEAELVKGVKKDFADALTAAKDMYLQLVVSDCDLWKDKTLAPIIAAMGLKAGEPKKKFSDDELLAFLVEPRKQGEVAKFLGVTGAPAKARLEKLKKEGKVKSTDNKTAVLWQKV